MDKTPLLSIVMPVYNTERFLRKCLDSVLTQTYQNLEVIIVDDCSPGNVAEIAAEYMEKDPRVKLVRNEENQGLFKARLRGYEQATGEYFASIDSDDYIGVDYYRMLMENIVSRNADIAVSKFVIHQVATNTYRYRTYGNYAIEDLDLYGEDVLLNFFHTNGDTSHRWLVWNKVYKKSLWDKAYPYFLKLERHHIMLEDVIYGCVLMSMAQHYVSVDEDTYYYAKHVASSTGTAGGFGKIYKNVSDIVAAFEFLDEYLGALPCFDQISESYQKLKVKFCRVWYSDAAKFKLTAEENDTIISMLDQIAGEDEYKEPFASEAYFYNTFTPWDNRYEQLKKRIINPITKYVSFDIFDTLVVRPFLKPSDMFVLLNDKYKELGQRETLEDFATMRVKAEASARIIMKNEYRYEDITIDEIYDVLVTDYGVDRSAADILMEEEKKLEIRFCTARQKVKELYELAIFLEKPVIITTDMYLDRETLTAILEKNGYTKYQHLYISCEKRLSKATGRLYALIAKELQIKPSEILHMGDNWKSDCEKSKANGWASWFIPKTTELFMNQIPNIDKGKKRAKFSGALSRNVSANYQKYNFALGHYGFRCMLAMIANKFFDNPYGSFEPYSDYNRNPYYLGYFALGTHVYGIVKWLLSISKGKCDTIHFVARDGYAAKLVYDVVTANDPDAPKSNYFYMSRKSFLPLLITCKQDLYMLKSFSQYKNKTPMNYIEMLTPISRNLGEEELYKLYKKKHIRIDKPIENDEQYNAFMDAFYEISYDETANEKYRSTMKKYVGDIIRSNDMMFDIGYSGRAQAILSILLGRGVDAAYVHLLNGDADKYADRFDFKVHTYYDFTPTIIGKLREVIVSEPVGSCIGYNIAEDGTVTPQFEKCSYGYHEIFVMEKIHAGATDFARDITTIFSGFEDKLFARSAELGFALELFLHHPSKADIHMFSPFYFEDDVQEGKAYSKRKLTDIWWNDMKWNKLIAAPAAKSGVNTNTISALSLPNDNEPPYWAPAWKKALYYLMFDRAAFKEKLAIKYEGKPVRYKMIMGFYKFGKGVKNIFVRKPKPKNNKKTTATQTPPVIKNTPAVSFTPGMSVADHVVYYAASTYNLLCCIAHRYKYHPEEKAILLLSDWRGNMLQAVEESGLFDQVITYHDIAIRKYINSSKKITHDDWMNSVEKELNCYLSEASAVVFGNGVLSLTNYCEYKNIQYECIEDGAGIYSDPSLLIWSVSRSYPVIERNSIEKYHLIPRGDNCLTYYVNYAAQIENFDMSGTVDFRPIDIVASMPEEMRTNVLDIFGVNETDAPESNNNCLILTYPLSAREGLTVNQELCVYALLADIFASDCEGVYLKPHPDDKVDFSLLSEMKKINPVVLSELIKYETNANFSKTICAVSSSANNLMNVGEKILFNSDFAVNSKDMLKYYSALIYINTVCGEDTKLICDGIYAQMIENMLKNTDICTLSDNTVYTSETYCAQEGKSAYMIGQCSAEETGNIISSANDDDIIISLNEFDGANRRVIIEKKPLIGTYLVSLEPEILYVRNNCPQNEVMYEQVLKNANVMLSVTEETIENVDVDEYISE